MKKPLLLLALLALPMGLLAQDNAAKLALAQETIAAMKADKMFDSMAAQMRQMAASSMTLPADTTPENRQKAEELQGKMMDLTMGMLKGMMAKMGQVYADVYSEAELNAMKAFFTSSEGQSMLAKQPQIMTRIMPLVQEMQREMMPKIQQLVAEAKAAEAAAKTPDAPVAK
jgi:hypothetical protein